MKDDDFSAYDDPAHEKYDLSDSIDDEAKTTSWGKARYAKGKRRRLEELLEEKQLRQELEEYDDYLDSQGSYYDDDIFSEHYIKCDKGNH
jgi:hypothetical protein